MRTSCIWIKKHDEHFIVVSMGFITLEPKKHDEHSIVVSLGFITLEQKKHDDEELSFSSSCAWLSCNIRTKEHNHNELSSLLSWPWGPPTLQQKKNMTMRSWILRCFVPGTCSISTKNAWWWRVKLFVVIAMGTSKHDDKEPSFSLCFWDLQHWNKKMHDEKELSSLSSWPQGPAAFEEKKYNNEEPNSLLSCPWDLQHWNKICTMMKS
jgi:hypothetical protein